MGSGHNLPRTYQGGPGVWMFQEVKMCPVVGSVGVSETFEPAYKGSGVWDCPQGLKQRDWEGGPWVVGDEGVRTGDSSHGDYHGLLELRKGRRAMAFLSSRAQSSLPRRCRSGWTTLGRWATPILEDSHMVRLAHSSCRALSMGHYRGAWDPRKTSFLCQKTSQK